jgi:hypothetical protein
MLAYAAALFAAPTVREFSDSNFGAAAFNAALWLACSRLALTAE